MESILPFVGLPALDQSRHDCLMAHKAGMFKRKHKSLDSNEVLEAFPQEMRLKLDNIIDHINLNILKRRGYRQMPLHAYKFYKQVREKSHHILMPISFYRLPLGNLLIYGNHGQSNFVITIQELSLSEACCFANFFALLSIDSCFEFFLRVGLQTVNT